MEEYLESSATADDTTSFVHPYPSAQLSFPSQTLEEDDNPTTVQFIEESDIDADDGTPFIDTSQSRIWKFLKYTWKWVKCILHFFFDLLSADNKSLVSRVSRVVLTASSFGVMLPNLAGQILWGMAYLIEHGWYPLAVTSSILLLMLSAAILTSYEWMWRWQENTYCCGFSPRGGANGAIGGGVSSSTSNRDEENVHVQYRPIVVVMDDNEIDLEEDLSVRGWMKKIGRIAGFGVLWFLYCLLNVRLNFWIWNQYIVANPHHHPLKLRLVACLAVTPILVGAAALLYFAHPPFYRWHRPPPPTVQMIAGGASSSTSSRTEVLSSGTLWGGASPDNMVEGDESAGLERLLP
jgi:hypothetical protein